MKEKDGSGEDDHLMVGRLEVFTERGGSHRWVQCQARLDAFGFLALHSVQTWSLRLQLPLRTAISLLRLGSASWHYLRLQMPTQIVYLQAQSEESMQSWVKNIQRVSGIRLVSQDYSSWVDLHVEQSSEKGDPPPPSPWRRAWLVLLSNRQLMWFHSEYGPLIQGCVDLHKVASVKPSTSHNDGRGNCLEIRALAVRWTISADEIPVWQRQLALAVEVCRRNAEAQRLIKINLQGGRESGRESAFGEHADRARCPRSSCRANLANLSTAPLSTLLSPRATLRRENSQTINLHAKRSLVEGWLQLSWLPSVQALGGRLFCSLRAADPPETPVLECSTAASESGSEPSSTDATVLVGDAVALHPAECTRATKELRLVFSDRVACLRCDRGAAAADRSLVEWHTQLKEHVARGEAARRVIKAIPTPAVGSNVLHSGWVSRRSSSDGSLSSAMRPQFGRLHDDGRLELVRLQAAQSAVVPQVSSIQLALVDSVGEHEDLMRGGCCVFPLFLRPGLFSETMFEISSKSEVEIMDAHDPVSLQEWVAKLRREVEACRQGPEVDETSLSRVPLVRQGTGSVSSAKV